MLVCQPGYSGSYEQTLNKCHGGVYHGPTTVAPWQGRAIAPKFWAVGKFWSKNAKFRPENPPFWENLGAKLKFWAIIISAVGKLQLPALPSFFNPRRHCRRRKWLDFGGDLEYFVDSGSLTRILIAKIRYSGNWHFAAYLSKLRTDFNEILWKDEKWHKD